MGRRFGPTVTEENKVKQVCPHSIISGSRFEIIHVYLNIILLHVHLFVVT